ncbi:hypothetical protein GALMADRAFT_250859 [Galerina marginata CBS 339.88]|uniref:Peptidase C14 caspase domain-containing protein n=1 Tax=Galerina marginata (strain CBS 339.88) TaxID=685588 RepID=A0A067ST28_GALM3|nr:hypothetical protein GALMADRAFT_250859 [Galerina marginata CBS 339.88]
MSAATILSKANSSITSEERRQFWQKLFRAKVSDSNQSFLSPIKVASPKPRLFALLIGINFYANVRSLRCAVSDALNFKEYLENYLEVPTSQIRTLLNNSASRSAIIEALTGLERDPRIQKGDPIFIFYAGHGSEISGPAGDPGAKIQALVPQDYCVNPGQEVPGIPDRTVGVLLSRIAETKGDNITVVFDCCHSASGTRGNEDVRVRSIEIEPSSHDSESLDQDIWDVGSRAASIAPGFLHSGLRSHVLIAACSSSEFSVESTEHGNFSSAFLKLLRSVPPDKLRYRDILTHMDAIPSQNPQCEGVNQSRFLFDAKVSKPVRLCYNLRLEENEIVLDAGAAHGIANGAEFVVYKDTNSFSEVPVGTLIVDSLKPFSAIMKVSPEKTPFTLTKSSVAMQTSTGDREDIRLYIPLSDGLFPCYQAWLSLTQDSREYVQNISLVDTPQDAHLELRMENDKVIFLIKDERITQHGFTRMYYGVEPSVEELVPIMKAAAHYYWKLNLTNNNPDITSSIQMEFYKLDASEFNFDEETGLPDMTTSGPNMCKNNVVDFVVDEDSPYGIKLTNNGPYDFYPYLFYFDNSDLSIGEYYQPPSSGRYTLDVPLKANGGTLTIGYGSGGSSPFSYFLREDQNLDVGFLKLFISTKPIDLSNIPQTSAFEKTRGEIDLSKKSEEVWGTILLPVIQRRYSPAPESHCVQCGSQTAKSRDIQQTKTISELETQIEFLKQELDVLRQIAAEEKLRLKEEVSSLRTRLDQLEKQNTGSAQRTSDVEIEANLNDNRLQAFDDAPKRNVDPIPKTPAHRPTLSERARKFFGFST